MTNESEQDLQEYADIANDIASQAQHVVDVLDGDLEDESDLSPAVRCLHALVEVLNAHVQLAAIDLVTDLENDDEEDEEDDDEGDED